MRSTIYDVRYTNLESVLTHGAEDLTPLQEILHGAENKHNGICGEATSYLTVQLPRPTC
jgi:hypothetical protein